MEITGVSRPQEISPDISSDALEAFDCEVPVLNDWLRSRVFLSEKFSGRSTYVVLTPEGYIAGYFCLSNAVISGDRLSPAERRTKLDPMPCLLLVRLAVDRNWKNKGLGKVMLVEALKITKEITDISNIYALVVEPGSESESSFYEHFGFRKCKSGEIPILFFEIGNSEVGNDDGKSKRMTTKERKELQSILAKITPENLHTRMDFGNPIGNEQL